MRIVRRGQGQTVTTTTDEAGRFFARELAAGSYDITARKTGYFEGNFGQRHYSGPSLAVELTDQATVSVRLPVWKFGAVYGQVVDEKGAAIAGLQVNALRRLARGGTDFWTATKTTRTDDRGHYRLGEFLDGEFLLLAGSAPEASQAPVAYPLVGFPMQSDVGLAEVLVLTAGEERALNFALRSVPTRKVVGKVVGRSSKELVQTVVRVVVDSPTSDVDVTIATTTCSADGSFSLLLPDGSYILEAFPPVAESTATSFEQASAAPSPRATLSSAQRRRGRAMATRVRVGSDGASNVILSLPTSVSVVGTVRYQEEQLPFSRAVAVLAHENGRSFLQFPIDPNGKFKLEDVVPGNYFVQFVSYPSADVTIEAVERNGFRFLDRPIPVGERDPEVLDVLLSKATSGIAGTVKDNDSTAMGESRASVLVFPQAPGMWTNFGYLPTRFRTAFAAADGSFLVRGLPPGPYLLVAVKQEHGIDWQRSDRLAALSRLATRIEVKPNEIVRQTLTVATPPWSR